MTQIEIFRQKFDKMVDNIPASVDSGAGYVIDEVYKIFDSLQQEQLEVSHWKPSKEQMGALNYAYCELFKREDVGHNILGPLQNLIDTLSKL